MCIFRSLLNKGKPKQIDPESQHTEDPTGIDSSASTQIVDQNESEQEMKDHGKLMVHIDNGHASTTAGKRSPAALIGLSYGNHTVDELTLYEYQYNRRVSKTVNERLKKLGFKTYMVTPELDYDVPVRVRASRSNEMKNKYPKLKHIFISCHVNAHGNGDKWDNGNNAAYWSAFTSVGQTAGDKLADCFYEAAEDILPRYGIQISTQTSDGDKDWEANYTVLKETNIPAVLVESLFMTNVDNVLFLKSKEGFDAIIEIYVRAIIKYFDKYIK